MLNVSSGPSTPYCIGEDGVYQTPIQTALYDRQFPSRWVYPESEQNLKPNFPGQASVTDKAFGVSKSIFENKTVLSWR